MIELVRPLWISLVVVLFACHSVGPTKHVSQSPSVLDSPVQFVGPRGATFDPTLLGEIRLGLFAPHSPENPVGTAMCQGAELAIAQANSSGGIDGVPVRLVRRWDPDPWRGGSKQMIKLVYEDSVWAVIGSVNGEATHVAEQVVTKAWLPLLSPVSADPTLTYIRIPWMFRLPPNDERQAAVIALNGIAANSLTSVGLVTSTDHDGRIFAEEMLEQMAVAQAPPAFHLQVPVSETDLNETAQRASSFGPDGIIMRLPGEKALVLLDSFEAIGLRVPLLLPWIPGLSPADLRGRYHGKVMYVIPFAETGNPSFAAFSRDYFDRFGANPLPSAAYTFDAVGMLVESLREAGRTHGMTRAGLRETIAGASGYVGATGQVSWDNAGGNQTEPILKIIR